MQNISNYPVVRSGEAPRKRCAQILKLHTATEPSEAPEEEEQNQHAAYAKTVSMPTLRSTQLKSVTLG